MINFLSLCFTWSNVCGQKLSVSQVLVSIPEGAQHASTSCSVAVVCPHSPRQTRHCCFAHSQGYLSRAFLHEGPGKDFSSQKSSYWWTPPLYMCIACPSEVNGLPTGGSPSITHQTHGQINSRQPKLPCWVAYKRGTYDSRSCLNSVKNIFEELQFRPNDLWFASSTYKILPCTSGIVRDA